MYTDDVSTYFSNFKSYTKSLRGLTLVLIVKSNKFLYYSNYFFAL